MGMTCIIAEKPSVARELAAIVGADSRENNNTQGKADGLFNTDRRSAFPQHNNERKYNIACYSP